MLGNDIIERLRKSYELRCQMFAKNGDRMDFGELQAFQEFATVIGEGDMFADIREKYFKEMMKQCGT